MTDKDMWIAKNILPKNNNVLERKPRKNVKSLDISYATRKTKLTLCTLPSWAIFMPPYSIARLCGLTREAGYLTRVYDFNVEAYHDLIELDDKFLNAWDSGNWYFWRYPEYYDMVHPTFEPILMKYIDILLKDEPDILGFSLYWTNLEPTQWAINEIKKQRPNITIIVGGPQCAEQPFNKPDNVDYYFVGESEQNLLDFLNNWEEGIKPTTEGIGSLYSDTRIDLDSLPYPDYSDFDLNKYWAQNSICSEISRGCIAKCAYCTEVWFWKFRDRGSKSVLDEIEFQVKTYNIKFIQFVDSLVNGNLKEYRSFCEGLVERNLGLSWWGYARADGRIDLEFYKLIKAAGAVGFSYGFETGSDKVLKAINKKNTVAEINQNLIDAHSVGLKSNCCLVIGAPGEDIEALMHTFNMLWNHRARISAVSPGQGLGDARGSLYDDRERYNISDRDKEWLCGWYSLDFTNTKLHRYIRIKLLHIWIQICVDRGGTLENIHSTGDGDITKHYSCTFNDEYFNDHVPYENFDFNIIQSDLGIFANSVMNEAFSLLRMLWRVKGAYNITIIFDPVQDKIDFVPVMTKTDAYDYTSKIEFSIDDNGNYRTNMYFKFVNFDQILFTDKDFEYRYTATGHWGESIIHQPKKVFRIQVAKYKMPVESCFSQLPVLARNKLAELVQKFPNNSHVVDVKSNLGGVSAILASVNDKIKVHAFESFENHWVKNCWNNIQWYIEKQLSETMFESFRDKKKAKKIVQRIEDDFLIDPSGKLVFARNTSNYQNVELHESLCKIDVPIHLVITCDYDSYGMKETLNCFKDSIVQNGYLVASLYDLEKHPDVVIEIDNLLNQGWSKVFQEGMFIIIQKP